MADQRREPNQRPSPEALLAKASKEESRAGRLKIFLGAAPGVGKTYEMLTEARGRLKEGADVVVGVVETHGRKETEALTEGLETIPRKRVDYKDRELDEMDIDAILARRPKLVLVDELAHTNAAGSRHPKRYLDVEEILNNGIDVYTTLNIQHIESLNDIVAQITHVRVRETVPNSILDRADAIELVDITPEDLIQRLRDGKVYIPQQAERALEHFFSPANLTALRELALGARQSASTSSCSASCRRGQFQVLGPPASASSSASARTRALRGLCATRSVSPIVSMPLGPRSMSKPSAACSSPRRSAIASPTRSASHKRSAGSRLPFQAAAATSPKMSSLTRKQTTSRRSSSASRRGHGCSSCCMARWCATSCVTAAISASTSSPARSWTMAPSPRRPFAPATVRRLLTRFLT